MKKCTKCKIEKDEGEFYKKSCNKDGLANQCKECNKEYIKNNKEKIKICIQKYRKKNKEVISEKYKEYCKKNKEKILEIRKRYQEENKEIILERRRRPEALKHKREYDKRYRENNREKKNNFEKFKKQKDITYKLRKNISAKIWHMLKTQHVGKNNSILNCLPYNMQQLKEHLESQFESWMNWENWGPIILDGIKRWQIDHIVPHSLLPYDNMEHENFQKCWALENLRPLEAMENIKKSNKVING